MNAVDTLAEGMEKEPERIGPYIVYSEIGCGGMATVHLGKLQSASGFSRIVAIKRMHANLSRSPEFVTMFFEEARLVSRIQHPNVVAALDCVAAEDTVMLVMEYVHGVSLDHVTRSRLERGETVPPAIAASIVIDAALGLHAAHEAVDEMGKNLGIVHRDVSPHNILVGEDGVARVLDFGIAKAAERAHHTRTGEVKGKLGYMAPEQLFGNDIGREADVYALGVILWELLTGRRLFADDGHGQMLMRIANNQLDRPSAVNPSITPEVEAMVMKALARTPETRYRTALELVVAIENTMPQAGQRALGEWVATVGRQELAHRSALRSHMDLSMPSRILDARELTGRRRLIAGEGTPAGAKRASHVAAAPRRLSGAYSFAAGIGATAIVATAIAQWPRPTTSHAPATAPSSTVSEPPAPASAHGGPPSNAAAGTVPTDPSASASAESPVLSAPSAGGSPAAGVARTKETTPAGVVPAAHGAPHGSQQARSASPPTKDMTTPLSSSSASSAAPRVLDIGSIGGRE
jgi:serine/threonine-protein kinase